MVLMQKSCDIKHIITFKDLGSSNLCSIQTGVEHITAGQEEGLLGLYRGKFLKFLKTSNVYNPEDILVRLPFDSKFIDLLKF